MKRDRVQGNLALFDLFFHTLNPIARERDKLFRFDVLFCCFFGPLLSQERFCHPFLSVHFANRILRSPRRLPFPPYLTPAFRACTRLCGMPDDKKREDYTIEIGDREKTFDRAQSAKMSSQSRFSANSITNNPAIAILAYCGSSILMTVTNKYVLAGRDFNLNFFLLCVQVGTLTLTAYGAVADRSHSRLCA